MFLDSQTIFDVKTDNNTELNIIWFLIGLHVIACRTQLKTVKEMVRKERLELSQVALLEPKSSASTNSATFAFNLVRDYSRLYP